MCLHGVFRLCRSLGIQKRNPDRIWRLVIAPGQRLLQGLSEVAPFNRYHARRGAQPWSKRGGKNKWSNAAGVYTLQGIFQITLTVVLKIPLSIIIGAL